MAALLWGLPVAARATPPPLPVPGRPPEAAPTFGPVPPTDDWHYPAEEASEMQALSRAGLQVTRMHAASNVSGSLTLRLANGSTATAWQPGDMLFGWTLRGFLVTVAADDGLADGLAVLELNAARWGLIAFLGPGARLDPSGVSGGHVFRKGVGRVAALRRPPLDLRPWRQRGGYASGPGGAGAVGR